MTTMNPTPIDMFFHANLESLNFLHLFLFFPLKQSPLPLPFPQFPIPWRILSSGDPQLPRPITLLPLLNSSHFFLLCYPSPPSSFSSPESPSSEPSLAWPLCLHFLSFSAPFWSLPPSLSPWRSPDFSPPELLGSRRYLLCP